MILTRPKAISLPSSVDLFFSIDVVEWKEMTEKQESEVEVAFGVREAGKGAPS